ncbi:uncharacterized protein LOC126968022 isoform X2 [Leptidea sinapis]|uniref:Uncharacterized protein n=1 Tax=Leptidea sinapis TaxID=189913 RepID=A0A5E4PSA9_9NEOP|nr:uncharacterized protein LOC126968022 isoform X2 [Leptidea sinapis]VVC88145.1 unnamed protein product [Leptidea sinapis]
MLQNKPKSKLKSILKWTAGTIFVVEVTGVAVTYGLWYRLNTERDFRLYMHNNYSWLLEGYYSIGERFGGLKTREQDKIIWKNEGKI